ncbi:MAG: MmcQ/YjbR family DNA-binding protein [Fibrobacteria bacterium]
MPTKRKPDSQAKTRPKGVADHKSKNKPESVPKDKLKASEAALRGIGMTFPEVTEDFPWGHRALKVKGKAFVFMSREEDSLGLSMKLPDSADFALMQPFAASTGYGLGKSGWVTATFGKRDRIPLALLGDWLRESYLAIAPKKLAALLQA